MSLLDVKRELRDFDKLCIFLKDFPEIIRRIFDEKYSNYHIALMSLKHSRLATNFMKHTAVQNIEIYEEDIIKYIRNQRVRYLAMKECELDENCKKHISMISSFDIHFTHFNFFWKKLENEIGNNMIDVTNKEQLGLLINISGFILFLTGMIRYMYPKLTELTETLDYLSYGLLDIKAELLS